MEQEVTRRRLKWLLAVVSFVAGVVWILAAFDVVQGEETLNILYLVMGMVFLVASGAWFLGLRV